MLSNREKIFLVILSSVFLLIAGAQIAYSWTGTANSISPGYLEIAEINATTEIYRQGDNFTAWIESLSYNETINELIELWNDEGLGGPNRTEKPYDYEVRNKTIGGTNYAFMRNGLTGEYMGYSADHDQVIGWAYSNITDPDRDFERRILLYGYFDNMNGAVDIGIAGNYTTTNVYGLFKFNGAVVAKNMFEINGADALNFGITGIKWSGGIYDGYRGAVAGVCRIFEFNITDDVNPGSEHMIELYDMMISDVPDTAIYIDAYNDDTETSLYPSGEYRIHDILQRKSGGGLELKGLSELKIYDSEFSGDTYAIELVGCGPVEIDAVYTNGGNRFTTVTTLRMAGGFHDSAGAKPFITGRALRWSTIEDAVVRVYGNGGNTDADVILLESYSGIHSIHNTVRDILAGRMQGSGTSKWAMFINETDVNQDWNTYESLTISTLGDFDSTQLFQILGANSKVESDFSGTSGRFSGSETKYGTLCTDDDDTVYFQWTVPPQFNQLIRMTVNGVTYNADADGGMVANITAHGGKYDEAWNTHNFALTGEISTQTIAIYDIIGWDLTGADTATLWAFTSGDVISVIVEFHPVSGLHSETNAAIQGILWEYL